MKSMRYAGESRKIMNGDAELEDWYRRYFLNQKLRDHFKPFSNIIQHRNLTIFVHSSTLSMYDIIKDQWKHKKFHKED